MGKFRWLFSWYFKIDVLKRILLGLFLGAIIGVVIGPEIVVIKPLGDIFLRLLKMIVVPVVMFTLIVGASSISPSKMGKIGIKIIVYYLFTSLFAVVIGLIVSSLFGVGRNLGIDNPNHNPVVTVTEGPSFSDTFLNIIPTNPFEALSSGNILQIIFFAILFGIGLSVVRHSDDKKIREAADIVFNIFELCSEVFFKIVYWILEYAPIGVFALIAVVFGTQGVKVLNSMLSVTAAIYIAFLAHTILVYFGLLSLFKVNVSAFIKKSKEAIITAFVTRSSSGTLPVSMDVSEKEMGISKSIYSFTLPVGATINMDGTIIYLGVCALFIANMVGLDLTYVHYFTIIVVSVLASIGTAGVPSAGLIMLVMVLNSIGLDINADISVSLAYAMILGIDAILDMGRTCLNVTGDLTGTVIVAASEDEINKDIWEQ